MKDLAWIYISNTTSYGSQQQGWSTAHEGNGSLPPVANLAASWNGNAFLNQRVGIVLEDDLLFPMRITLDEAPPKKERHQYLLWKLKRHLPYPVEQVSLRYLPLSQANTYLTYSLPTPWLQEMDQLFQSNGVHCGYVGGLFSTLIENATNSRGKASIGIFGDFYLLAQQSGRGDYERFNVRRLPFLSDQRLDVETMVQQDLEPFCEQASAANPVYLYNFEPALDSEFRDIMRRLKTNLQHVHMAPPHGNALKRFKTYLERGGMA